MKALGKYIYKKLHKQIGKGSCGSVYTSGKDWVIKFIEDNEDELNDIGPVSPEIREKEREIIDNWSKIKTGLTVIPYIKNWDGNSYRMRKLICPCPEGELLYDALGRFLKYYPDPDHSWLPADTHDKIREYYGEETGNFIVEWFRDFIHDYNLITKEKYSVEDDIKPKNIGKDPVTGKVYCFDFIDLWCI